MIKKSLLYSFIFASLVCCGSHKNDSKIASKQMLIDKLELAAKSGIVFYGQQDATLYGHTWFGERGRSDIKDVSGDYPAILGFDCGGIELGHLTSLDNIRFDNMRTAIVDHYNRGGIITISWHLANPVTDGNSWDLRANDPVQSILPNQPHHKKFIGWLDRLSAFFLSLKTENGDLIPIIFRPWHEHTGTWFWWGQNHCTTDEYIALWKFTKSYLDSKGLTNLVYAYSPNLGVNKKMYLERYPGDSIIDLLGIDIYQFSTKDSTGLITNHNADLYISETQKALKFLSEIGAERSKPIAFTETGYEGIPMPNWWTDVLYQAIKGYPISYVLTWRNACDRPEHFYAPFPGQISANDFIDFTNKNNIGLLKRLTILSEE